MLFPKCRIEMFGCFSDNFKVSDNRILDYGALEKLLLAAILGIALDFGYAIRDVLEVYPVVLFYYRILMRSW